MPKSGPSIALDVPLVRWPKKTKPVCCSPPSWRGFSRFENASIPNRIANVVSAGPRCSEAIGGDARACAPPVSTRGTGCGASSSASRGGDTGRVGAPTRRAARPATSRRRPPAHRRRAPTARAARAVGPAHGGHEDRARDRVGEEVGRVRVQGERRHRAPRLAAHDQLGRGAPGPGPRTARVRRPRDAVEGDEQHGDENPDVRPSVLRRLRGRGCAPPLGIVPVQRRNGPVGVARRHEETPLPRARGDAMGDARGGEDESPLLDRAPLARGAERTLLLAHREPPRASGREQRRRKGRISGILRPMPPAPRRIEPGPGQESVWDYPRPPRVEGCGRQLRVVFNGCVVAETTRALRVLETSQPPAYYFPPEDVRLARFFTRTRHTTLCEWKGVPHHYSIPGS